MDPGMMQLRRESANGQYVMASESRVALSEIIQEVRHEKHRPEIPDPNIVVEVAAVLTPLRLAKFPA
jgi:hypothetical protein